MEGKSLIERVRQWPIDLKNYVQELQMEMRRVTWPSRKQVRATTMVVLVTVFMFAVYFAVVDFALARTIGKIFEVFSTT
jgi:preprotein translocase subunit SecE